MVPRHRLQPPLPLPHPSLSPLSLTPLPDTSPSPLSRTPLPHPSPLTPLPQILDASLAAVQGMDYAELRLFVELLVDALSSQAEADAADKWYFDHFKVRCRGPI